MKTRVLFLLALMAYWAFASEANTPQADSQEASEPNTDEDDNIEVEDVPNDEPDRDATYFTQETLNELQNLDKYKNNKLWTCHLLTTCKLKTEQVFKFISLESNHGDYYQSRYCPIFIYKDFHGSIIKLL